MEYQIRRMDKEDESDWELFDQLQLDSFRGAQPDRDTLTDIELETRFEEFDKNDPIDYKAHDQIMYIAEDVNGKPIGIIWFCDRKPFWRFNEQHVWIYNLNIMKDYRRNGIAIGLIKMAEKYGQRNNLPYLALHVLDFNQNARNLYEKLEFKLVETHNESCFYQKYIK